MDELDVIKVQTDNQLYYIIFDGNVDSNFVPQIFSSKKECLDFLKTSFDDYDYELQNFGLNLAEEEAVDMTTPAFEAMMIGVEKLKQGLNPNNDQMDKVCDIWSFLTLILANEPALTIVIHEVIEEYITPEMLAYFQAVTDQEITDKGWVDLSIHAALASGVDGWNQMLHTERCPREDIIKYVGHSLDIMVQNARINSQTFVDDFKALQQRTIAMAFSPRSFLTQ
ncbi:hypothetical protein COT97_03180 [Candidatus Falkowbacteria bacterium CG10_big_fil_rev_8_21_14_0_10_39_11]|uniref:Uncharacterized protein n=1 Tax=Candidatus Falkowbacteria bacterium CG10_big_fil_rev_8_21_14_0_10_39_11 TaxID=1974565 RepID=A0A2H0V4X8_9BACT|nr:MAG: hypothetical protein COT97_03180 [Candidatus Falkowbacteria bacterium CG10_big_fil_rev_8_21_14_0_10_39_11]